MMDRGLLAQGMPPQSGGMLGGMMDTGMNVPESMATLIEQERAVLDGRRPAAMFPLGSPEPPLPDGLARVETPRGVFHFNPQQIGPHDIQAISAAGKENEVLGLGPFSKSDIEQLMQRGESPLTVTERTPQGVEVKAAMGTPSTVQQQAQAIRAGAAPGHVVGVEPLQNVIGGRVGGLLQSLMARR